MVIKKLFISLIILLLLMSCKKVDFVNSNSTCIFKNLVIPLDLPFKSSDFKDNINKSLIESKGVLYLNVLSFKNIRKNDSTLIADSIYSFLYREYIKCETETFLNLNGEIPFGYQNKNDDGGFLYCGTLNIQSSITSLLFIRTLYKKYFIPKELILFNIKDNKLYSFIKLSDYHNEIKEEDILAKSYLFQNKKFLFVSIHRELKMEIAHFALNLEDNKIILKDHISKETLPISYALFDIEPTGYINFMPEINNILNLSLLIKIGDRKPLPTL